MRNKEERASYSREYRKKNRVAMNEYKRKWTAEWRKNNPEKQIEAGRRHSQNRKNKLGERDYKESLRIQSAEWRKKNRKQYLALKTVFVAKRNGTLKQEPCQICGNQKSQAHHEDYSKPLEVIWLCKFHHVQEDRRRRERLAT